MSYILSTVSKYYILYSEKEKKKKKKYVHKEISIQTQKWIFSNIPS